jgi:hypothetical protein
VVHYIIPFISGYFRVLSKLEKFDEGERQKANVKEVVRQ